MPISRAQIIVDTLHPVHEGRVFRWRSDRAGEVVEYGRSSENEEVAEKWRQSPFYHLTQTGDSHLRCKLGDNGPARFPILAELCEEGQTEYMACLHRFARKGVIGEMDGVYSSWVSDAPAGFSDAEAEALRRSLPPLALAVKCASLARIAGTRRRRYGRRERARPGSRPR